MGRGEGPSRSAAGWGGFAGTVESGRRGGGVWLGEDYVIIKYELNSTLFGGLVCVDRHGRRVIRRSPLVHRNRLADWCSKIVSALVMFATGAFPRGEMHRVTPIDGNKCSSEPCAVCSWGGK